MKIATHSREIFCGTLTQIENSVYEASLESAQKSAERFESNVSSNMQSKFQNLAFQ